MSGYRCPNCNSLHTSVKSTSNHAANAKGKFKSLFVRRRQCQSCYTLFMTTETVIEIVQKPIEETPPKDYVAPPIRPVDEDRNPFL
jgi:transcriptional regulator NrdR family protein